MWINKIKQKCSTIVSNIQGNGGTWVPKEIVKLKYGKLLTGSNSGLWLIEL